LKKVKYKSSWEILKFLYDLGEYPQIQGVVTNIPMWRQKEQRRGFNQAKILANLIGTDVDLLERVRETKPQFGLNKEQRKSNIEGAFRIIHKHSNAQMHKSLVILVDDVWTTGATMRECAMVLKQSGVKEIWGIALAR
jgi:ComF family protein